MFLEETTRQNTRIDDQTSIGIPTDKLPSFANSMYGISHFNPLGSFYSNQTSNTKTTNSLITIYDASSRYSEQKTTYGSSIICDGSSYKSDSLLNGTTRIKSGKIQTTKFSTNPIRTSIPGSHRGLSSPRKDNYKRHHGLHNNEDDPKQLTPHPVGSTGSKIFISMLANAYACEEFLRIKLFGNLIILDILVKVNERIHQNCKEDILSTDRYLSFFEFWQKYSSDIKC